jgi:hypothetical protein
MDQPKAGGAQPFPEEAPHLPGPLAIDREARPPASKGLIKMRAGSLWDALRDGDPGVIIGLTLLALVSAVGIWLCLKRCLIRTRPGRLTVSAIHARLANEAARRSEFERNAVREAARTITAADAATVTIPLTEIPEPRTPQLADDGELTFAVKIGADSHPVVVPEQSAREFIVNAYETLAQLRLSTEKLGSGT